MSYASSIITLSADPAPATTDGRDYFQALAVIRGQEPVNVLLRTHANRVAAKALAGKQHGDHLVVSGELALEQPDNDLPIITAAVVCNATDDQYLNEVVIVGRVGSDPKEAESGKSTRRSVAINRYVRSEDPDATEPVEITDWYQIRAYGFVKDRLEAADKGALIEINGCFVQMSSAKGDAYCEVKARMVRVHRGSKGAGNPAAGTSAAGYDHDSFQGEPDDMPANWQS